MAARKAVSDPKFLTSVQMSVYKWMKGESTGLELIADLHAIRSDAYANLSREAHRFAELEDYRQALARNPYAEESWEHA